MKLLPVIVLILIFNYSSAQINKGSDFLGGNIGGTITNTKQNGVTFSEQQGFTFSPTYGKAIKDNLIIGFGFRFQITDEQFYGAVTDQKQLYYGVQFFVRKYKFLGNSSFALFIDAGLSAEYSPFHQVNTTPLETQDRKVYIADLYAYPGISYKVSRSLHLETGFSNLLRLQYLHQKYVITSSTTTTVTTNHWAVGMSLDNISQLYIGFRLLLSK